MWQGLAVFRSFGMKYSPYISVAPIYNSNCAGASTTLFGAPSCVLVSCDAIMLHRYTWFATPFRVATSCDGTCCGVTPCDVRSLQRQTLYGVTSCGATSCVFATPFRVATSCDGTCCGVTPCDVRSLQRQTLYGVTSCDDDESIIDQASGESV